MDAAGRLKVKPTTPSSSIMDSGADSVLQRETRCDVKETDGIQMEAVSREMAWWWKWEVLEESKGQQWDRQENSASAQTEVIFISCLITRDDSRPGGSVEKMDWVGKLESGQEKRAETEVLSGSNTHTHTHRFRAVALLAQVSFLS